MKYRISDFCVRKKQLKNTRLRARRRVCIALVPLPPAIYSFHDTASERIDISLLFEVGMLPEAERPKRDPLRIPKRIFKKCASAAVRVAHLAADAARWLASKRSRTAPRIAFWSGALCSAVLCALLSAAVVLFGLFGRFMLNIDMSAEPPKQDTPPVASDPYTVESFSGMTLSRSTLSLKNRGIAFVLVEEHSDTVERGIVISSSPEAGVPLYEGQMLTLTVSLGREIVNVRVPELFGLGEAAARSLLSERGLALGNISYKPSAEAFGTVIEQQYPSYTTLERGTSVDITVSLGSITQKKVPDLYGLTQEEAKAALADYGLVIGGIFSADSAAPKGTVVVQSPIAGTPITSTITSVDIYLSE